MQNKRETEAEGGLTHEAPQKKGSVVGKVLKLAVPLAITVALVWYMFTKVPFDVVMDTFRHGVDYKWILLAMAISVLSHVFRALRWRLQLRSLGIRPPLLALCCSIFGTYALNLVFPRLGEVWRCTYIARREKAPFTTVLGSMVADRLCDSLSVLLIMLLTLVVASGAIMTFLDKYPMGQGLVETVTSWPFWAALLLAVVVIWVVYSYTRQSRVTRKIVKMLRELWGGFADIARMKGRGPFLVLTVGIWGCYFLQLYAAFFAFAPTYDLVTESGTAFGLVPCLVAFVLSSIGMAVPANGGLGPWNMGIVFGLGLYGVAEAQAIPISWVIWSAQTVMLIILGVFTAIYTSRK